MLCIEGRYLQHCFSHHLRICYLFIWQEQGMSVLKKAIVACTEEIERHKGKLTVKEAPRTVRFIVFLYVIIDLSAVHL